MGFMRRKSVAAADAEEIRPRNRLSKPMTNKSPTIHRSVTTWNSSKEGSPNASVSSSRTTLQELARTMSEKESIVLVTSTLVEVGDEVKPTATVANLPRKAGVASLVRQFETAASTSHLSLVSPLLPQKPTSTTYGSQRLNGVQQEQHMQSVQSSERLRLHKNSVSTLASPSASLEQLVDSYAIPRRRMSNYRPGEATRKTGVEDMENQPPSEEERKEQADSNNSTTTAQLYSDIEYEQEQWTPPRPPSVARTESSSSVNFKAIGGLRLGSLHIVNGRSSPVLSELSRHLISRQLRDVSSEYADSTYSKDLASEAWEDAVVADEADDTEVDEPRTPMRTPVEAEKEKLSSPISAVRTPEQNTSIETRTSVHSPDKTSIMAQAYMAELQGSPFSYGSISPASTGSVVYHESNQEDNQLPEGNYRQQLLDDEHQTDARSFSLKSEQPSIESKPSVAETVNTRDQVFSSALEYQAPSFHPPPSPQRGISPESIHPDSSGRTGDKVDSGYNSGTSMLSLQLNEAKALEKHAPWQVYNAQANEESATKERTLKNALAEADSSPRKLGRFFPIRPAAKKAPATAPVVPTKGSLQLESTTNSSTAAYTVKLHNSSKKMKKEKEESPARAQKKLHKIRPLSRTRESKEIVVQRLASCESTLDLPAIPDTTKINLQFRSQQVPELQRTFTSQDHITSQLSLSALTIPTTEIRFPSPLPDSDNEESPRDGKKDRGRSKSRPRSKSRRRSFLDMFKSDKSAGGRDFETSKAETKISISDFGDVVASLGANPYDIAHSREQSPSALPRKVSNPKTNPHDISVNRPRQRTSMTDEEASQYARMRSQSVNGHGDKNERKQLSGNHGELAGKQRRASMVEEDVPPVPPLPGTEELRRISLRQSLQHPYLSTPTSVQKFWEQTPSSGQQLDSSPAPLPPTHSPRPSFIDRRYEDEHVVEEEAELAPPPPSHSPAPMDIQGPPPPSHSPRPRDMQHGEAPESPWEAQARLWRARRQSAEVGLRSHRKSLDPRGGDHTYTNEMAIEDDEEPIYPTIPSRHSGRQARSQQQPDQWSGSDHHGRVNHTSHIQRSQTWNEGDGLDSSYQYNSDHYQHSRSSYRARQGPRHTGDEQPDYVPTESPSRLTQQDFYRGLQSNQRSTTSIDSRQFYSHNNCPIDRPFDPPSRLSKGYNDEYGQNSQHYSRQASPARGRGRSRPDYGFPEYNGYEGDYDPHHRQYQPHYYPHDQYSADYHYDPHDQHYDGYNSPERSKSHQQYHHQQPSIHSPRPSPSRHHYNNLALPSHSPSRPTSRPQSRHSQISFHSNGSAISLAEELHPNVVKRPSPAPDFGRYSGGLSFGYEGRDAGFGGSAGTRSVSGRADGGFKGVALRGSHGVDLGDVPVIGVLKKVR